MALLGDRRASGGDDDGRAVARHVGDVVERVGGADIDVHHDRLRTAGHQVDAVRHRDREILVRHEHRLRHRMVGAPCARIGLHDRREIGAGIDEEIIDAVAGERAQEMVGGDRCCLRAPRFSRRPCRHQALLGVSAFARNSRIWNGRRYCVSAIPFSLK
ncbi:MAG: hypothetical protein GHHEDOFH_01238 [Pseudorhodoplanes sp.]|nr:hypothetical protein [Pseudorhodoplanes sp.]